MDQTGKIAEFKEILLRIVPNVFSLINGDPHWRTIESRMQTEYNKRMNNPVFVSSYLECNFYDLVYLATQHGDASCIHILGLFDYIFQASSQKMTSRVRDKVSKKIKDNILSVFNSDYIHFIGELAVFLIIHSEGKYKVINSEEKIPLEGNAKYADWYIQDLVTNETYFIEVVNIHLRSSNREENLKRTLQKIEQKKVETLGDGCELENFSIFPIIWDDLPENIIRLSEDLENIPKIEVNYHGPYALYAVGKTGENELHIQDRFSHINGLREYRS